MQADADAQREMAKRLEAKLSSTRALVVPGGGDHNTAALAERVQRLTARLQAEHEQVRHQKHENARLRDECSAELTCTPRGLRWVRRRYAYQPPALGTYRTHRAACPRAPRTVRTGYAYQPRALGTYSVPWHPRCSVMREALEARGEMGALQRALVQARADRLGLWLGLGLGIGLGLGLVGSYP